MNRLAILEQFVNRLGVFTGNFKPTTSFDELRMDSYAVVDFLTEVEKYFDIIIPDEKMLEIKTIQDVLDMIDESNKEEE